MTPLERAAKAIQATEPKLDDWVLRPPSGEHIVFIDNAVEFARNALTAALDRDEIARWIYDFGASHRIFAPKWDGLSETLNNKSRAYADAIIAHLLGESK